MTKHEPRLHPVAIAALLTIFLLPLSSSGAEPIDAADEPGAQSTEVAADSEWICTCYAVCSWSDSNGTHTTCSYGTGVGVDEFSAQFACAANTFCQPGQTEESFHMNPHCFYSGP